eukprot:jgi/Ulvmu1/4579/UM002_0308.1
MQTAEEWLRLLPPVTRAYLVLSFITTVLCSLEVVRELHLYFNFRQILQGQVWRLVTCFLYFAPFSFDFVFQMYLLVRYCRSLEEGSFRGRSSGFLWMLLLGATMMVVVAPFIKSRASMFLGPSLTFMVVYVWARRNPYVRLSLFGLFDFTAPYLPWVLLGFSMVLGASPVKDLLGIAVGHVYYFFEDVYPRMSHGYRLLATPGILVGLFGEDRASPGVQRPPQVAAAEVAQPTQDPPAEANAEQAPQGHLHAD